MRKLIILLVIVILSCYRQNYRYNPSNISQDGDLSYGQINENIVFNVPGTEISVKLSLCNGRFIDTTRITYLVLHVDCRVNCSEWRRSFITQIFKELTNDVITLDSLFQHLYDWVSEIEHFKDYYARTFDEYTMKYHYDNSTCQDSSYFLNSKSRRIIISTDSFFRDMEGWFCVRKTKMKFETITEFKNLLISYTESHNIPIRL